MKNKGKRMRTLAVALLLTVVFLSGCQLAKDGDATQGGNPIVNKDRLIGVYITTEHVNLEVWEQPADLETPPRLNAVLKSVAHKNPETGESSEHEEYVFEEVKGMAFYAAKMPSPDGQDFYTSSVGDEAIGNTNIHLNVADEGETITLEGTIYIGIHPTATPVFYMNPIYQTPSGEVYLLAGSGFSFNANLDGSSGSQTLDESTSQTENGQTKTYTAKLKMTYEVHIIPQRVTLLEMSAAHEKLKTHDFQVSDLPQELVLSDETAYLIAETWSTNGDGVETATRTILEADQEYLNTKRLREDGILIEHGTKLHWNPTTTP